MFHAVTLSRAATGFRRIACVQPCIFEGRAGLRSGVLWNLSAVGLYLVADPMPPLAERLWISFFLPGETQLIKTEAQVAWRSLDPSGGEPRSGGRLSLHPPGGEKVRSLPPGCGLQFLGLGQAARDRIEAHVCSRFGAVAKPAARTDRIRWAAFA